MVNPPGGVCPPFTGGCSGGFYDDRGYTTTTGVNVGTPGSVYVDIAVSKSVSNATPLVGQQIVYNITAHAKCFNTGG